MRKTKKGSVKAAIPSFKTEQEEADFWDTHSPLDFVPPPRLGRIRVVSPKNEPISIRLDTTTRQQLESIARKLGMGPSTFARAILVWSIHNPDDLPKLLQAKTEQGHENRQSDPTHSPPGADVSESEVDGSLMEKAYRHAELAALQKDQQTVVKFFGQISDISIKQKDEMSTVWQRVQDVVVAPLLIDAQKKASAWDYTGACGDVERILAVCNAFGMPLSYSFSCRGLSLASDAFKAASGWKGDIDDKLERLMTALAVRAIDNRESAPGTWAYLSPPLSMVNSQR